MIISGFGANAVGLVVEVDEVVVKGAIDPFVAVLVVATTGVVATVPVGVVFNYSGGAVVIGVVIIPVLVVVVLSGSAIVVTTETGAGAVFAFDFVGSITTGSGSLVN